MKRIVKKVNKMITQTATGVTKLTANTTCPFLIYQPKLPDTVKKLRKF